MYHYQTPSIKTVILLFLSMESGNEKQHCFWLNKKRSYSLIYRWSKGDNEEIFPWDILCKRWRLSIDPSSPAWFSHQKSQKTHVFHIGRPPSHDALWATLMPKTHRSPGGGWWDTWDMVTEWRPALKWGEGERERERERDEEQRAEEAKWFPGASSSAETNVMTPADVLNQRGRVYTDLNYLNHHSGLCH